MKTKHRNKRTHPKAEDEIVDNDKARQNRRSFAQSFGDPFKTSCSQIDKLIDSAPMDENDRTDLKNGIITFYEAIQLLMKDIFDENSDISQSPSINYIELTNGWNQYKADLIVSLKSPKRTDYINYVHTELLKIGLLINQLLDHPPITPQYRIIGPKVSEMLLTQFTDTILINFRKLFDQLLNDDGQIIDTQMIDAARNPLRKFRQELLKKYQIFFLTDSKDKPNQHFDNFMKYIDRILKKTQHFSMSHHDEVPSPVKQIDRSLLQIQKVISKNDAFWENLKNNTPLNLNFDTTESASYIRNALNLQFDASVSATGMSIMRFSCCISEAFSQVTGINNFIDNNNTWNAQSVISSSAIRDKERLKAPWFKAPMFSALESILVRMRERAAMIAARYTEDRIEKLDDAIGEDAYGERDVLLQQIKNAEIRLTETNKRHQMQLSKFENLKKQIQTTLENLLPPNSNSISKSSSSNTTTTAPAPDSKFRISSPNDLLNEIDAIVEYLKKMNSELNSEKKILLESDASQKTIGSGQFDEEIAITQAIYEEHERLMREMRKMREEIAKIKAENELIEKENYEKQGQCNDLSEKVDIVSEKVRRLKEKFIKRNKKIEWLRAETERLKFENDNMKEIEEKNKLKYEEKIQAVKDENRKLSKMAHRLPQVLQETIDKRESLENVTIPEIQYQIDKLLGILRFQTQQAACKKREVNGIHLQVLSKELQKLCS